MRRIVWGSRCVGLTHRLDVPLGLPARTPSTCIFDWDALRRPTKSHQQPIRVERLAILDRPMVFLRE